MNNGRIAVYPGTFDPVTNGHIDIISRAARLVEKLVVGVAVNIGKAPLFALEERVEMLEAEIAGRANDVRTHIIVEPFSNLLMDFVVAQGGNMVVRGLRAVSDFDYEFQMTGMNHHLNDAIETVFLMSQDKYQFISSRFVKEISRLGGDVHKFVTPDVEKALHTKFTK